MSLMKELIEFISIHYISTESSDGGYIFSLKVCSQTFSGSIVQSGRSVTDDGEII